MTHILDLFRSNKAQAVNNLHRLRVLTHSHAGINVLMLFESLLSILQFLLCFDEQHLENHL